MKEDNDKVQRQCVLIAARELTEQQRASLPSPMKHLVVAKHRILEMKEKM